MEFTREELRTIRLALMERMMEAEERLRWYTPKDKMYAYWTEEHAKAEAVHDRILAQTPTDLLTEVRPVP